MAKYDDRQQIIDEFDDPVNTTRKELEGWLQTQEPKSGRARATPRGTNRGAR